MLVIIITIIKVYLTNSVDLDTVVQISMIRAPLAQNVILRGGYIYI